MRIKADEALFEECLSLKYDLQLIAGIVQNDAEITREELQEWHRQITRLHHKLADWQARVVRTIPYEPDHAGREPTR